MITIFTPSYNRGHLLNDIYNSLCNQSYQNFEWIIVDDGSSDNTKNVIDSFSKSKFPIRYFYQKNGGKHRAINYGVQKANGDLFLILDSDDLLPNNSLNIIVKYYNQIKDNRAYGGVVGYIAHKDGNIIGKCKKKGIFDTTYTEFRNIFKGEGDMCEVFKTSVLKEFPFPEIEGEKFVPEALIWNRISGKYKLRYFPDIVYYRDYLDGGLTDKIIKIRMQSPIASTMCYQELSDSSIPFRLRFRASINYWRFRLCGSPHPFPKLSKIWYFSFPLGLLMHLIDLLKIK